MRVPVRRHALLWRALAEPQCYEDAMADSPDPELQLKLIFETYPTRVERYQAASRMFDVKPGSLQDSVFRLWFDERHADYEREQASKK
jgi:hypothetical protein